MKPIVKPFARLISILLVETLLAGCAARSSPVAVSANAPANPLSNAPPNAQAEQAYPPTRLSVQIDTLHGVSVSDPYRWLEDGSSSEVRRWLARQDDFARAALAKLPGRDALAARLSELLYVESAGVPRHHAGRWFFSRRDAGREKAVVYVREGRDGEDRALLDPNSWSPDGSVALGSWSVSFDGRLIAYAVKNNNSDEATLFVMDVATGKKRDADVIAGAKYGTASWTPRGDGFYYTWIPPLGTVPVSDRPGFAEVRFHRLGDDPRRDRVVRERTGDPRTFIGAESSRDGRWLVLSLQHGWSRTDVYVQDRHSQTPTWKPLVVGRDALYRVEVDGDRFFVHTNEQAPMYRVFRVSASRLQREAWTEVVPERKDATLSSLAVVGHRLALTYLKDVVSAAELRDHDGRLLRTFELPGLGSLGGMSGEVDDELVYYAFQSFTYPTEIFETSLRTGTTRSWYRLKVPVDPARYLVEQRFAISKDGTRVPFFVVRDRARPKDGATPTVLNAYGGFQVALTPVFSSSIYPWLEQGGIWAVANLRGGSEFGEEWHRQGMGQRKQNVFDDYFAVAEELVAQGYTRPENLVALGRSNGGLLVGAAVTQRPELFRVALCGVPLLDMVRYHRFGSGKTWIEEYGSADDEKDFAALLAYSPYHRVKAGTRYPATLLLSSDSDDRVDPMHARKFAAALQASSSGGPVLLRVERHAGHGGADLVKETVSRIADEYAFARAHMGPPSAR